MTPTYDMVIGAFVVGLIVPIVIYGAYWFALDSAKRYVDKEIRKVNR